MRERLWEPGARGRNRSAAGRLRDYEQELSIAHQIQAGFLPSRLPEIDGWELHACFRPAKEVAGDFYDVFELAHGRQVGLVVADVCDKGVGAALFMALIRTLLRHTAQHADVQTAIDVELADDLVATVDADLLSSVESELAEAAGRLKDAAAGREPSVEDGAATRDPMRAAVTEAVIEVAAGQGVPVPELPPLPEGTEPLVQAVVGTNRYLARNHLQQGYFATMFFAVLDPATGAVLYINGGHNPPVLRRADGSVAMLDPTGPAVGMMAESEFSVGHVLLEPGDLLFAYTDGVVEARDVDEVMFGTPPMVDLVRPGRTVVDVIEVVDTAVRRFATGAEQFDDITMLALRRSPAS